MYQHLGDCIGKGAFGSVYRGLNMQTGQVVAVKQIMISHLNQSAVESIAEISLLKKLNHKNIVKYFGLLKTDTHLNIIIEYCENGSLQSIYKRFGKFPENLTALYIAQVLEGLLYLHDQGVIHRDIKGANILSTKEGLVKLADFGVSTIANDDNAVVGSPYWMAPEVIELNGAKPVSDIWSVGCTVIELLEGNPPYHFLDPMPALFRIVQDDHPPLPQFISPVVSDFLLQCFQKDFNLRVTANKLLKHPWIQNASIKGRGGKTPNGVNFEKDIKLLQEWNEALNESTSPQNTSESLRQRLSPLYTQYNSLDDDFERMVTSPTSNLKELNNSPPKGPLQPRATQLSSIQPEEEEDNWDADFDISGSDINLDKIKKDNENAASRKNSSAVVPFTPFKSKEFDSNNDIDLTDALQRMQAKSKNKHGLDRLQANVLPLLAEKPKKIATNDPLAKYVEEEAEDYSDIFKTVNISGSTLANELFGSNGTMNTSLNGIENYFQDEEEEDIFHVLEEDLEQTDLQKNIIRNKNAKIAAEIKQIIKLLQPNQDPNILLNACDKLELILVENPHLRSKFINYHGILPILEILEVVDSEPILVLLLRIINLIVHNNVETQENLCLVGGIPVIISLASKRYSMTIRLEVAYFIRQLCHTSTFTLQMFISCRGLKILVDFIEEEYSLYKDLIWIAINGVASIFELQTPTPKHDFCRLFAKTGLLEPLSSVLLRTLGDEDALAQRYTYKIMGLFLIFSQADSYVKEMMGTSFNIVRNLFHEIKILPMELKMIVLKCIRNLSINPNTLDTLQKANAIEILVELLIESLDPTNPFGQAQAEMCHHVLNTMFNLCRINKHRQELAAQAGIIPHLQHIGALKSPLKPFAISILCDMAHAGKVCRRLLAKNNGLRFFLALLSDPNWQTNVLEAILIWLQEEPREVETVLLESRNLNIMVDTFVCTRNNTVFEGLIGPLPRVIRLSPKLAQAISLKSKFINKLLVRLVKHPKAIVRLSLLKILKSLLDQHLISKQNHINQSNQLLNGRYDIHSILLALSENDPAVLVREMAKEIITQFSSIF
ncbi:hypothetical protein K502DRAFT_349422 [Neoconidiobolus thromboides FSU 785]|nr:hypothetical protein K502DRAFT_349422 [Neoconidiobolus thromboides FSU 785]